MARFLIGNGEPRASSSNINSFKSLNCAEHPCIPRPLFYNFLVLIPHPEDTHGIPRAQAERSVNSMTYGSGSSFLRVPAYSFLYFPIIVVAAVVMWACGCLKVLFVDFAVGGKIQHIWDLCACIYVLELGPRDASTLGKESAAHPHLQLLFFLLIQGSTKLPRLTLSNSCGSPRHPLNLWLFRLRFPSSWDFRPVPSRPASLLPLTTVSLCFICMEISVFCMSSS